MQKDANINSSSNLRDTESNEVDKLSGFGNKWSGWATIIATIIALIALFGGGTFFYNEIWQSKELTYSILPTYDIGDQAFSGLVIENRGRVTLKNVQIIVSDLEVPITALNMPGAHETANLKSGGVGSDELFIEMPRLSSGGTLSIYILTSGVVKLEENQTFFISSDETKAILSSDSSNQDFAKALVLSVLISLATTFVLFLVGFFNKSLRRDEIAYIRRLEVLEKQRELLLQSKFEIETAKNGQTNPVIGSKKDT